MKNQQNRSVDSQIYILHPLDCCTHYQLDANIVHLLFVQNHHCHLGYQYHTSLSIHNFLYFVKDKFQLMLLNSKTHIQTQIEMYIIQLVGAGVGGSHIFSQNSIGSAK